MTFVTRRVNDFMTLRLSMAHVDRDGTISHERDRFLLYKQTNGKSGFLGAIERRGISTGALRHQRLESLNLREAEALGSIPAQKTHRDGKLHASTGRSCTRYLFP